MMKIATLAVLAAVELVPVSAIVVVDYNQPYDVEAAVLPVATVCREDFIATVKGDQGYLARYVVTQNLTDAQTRRLQESCIFFGLGALTTLEAMQGRPEASKQAI